MLADAVNTELFITISAAATPLSRRHQTASRRSHGDDAGRTPAPPRPQKAAASALA